MAFWTHYVRLSQFHGHRSWLVYEVALSNVKIEVFNALQTRFGPSKHTPSQNSPSKRNPILKMKTSLKVLNIICPPQEPTSVGIVTTRSGVRQLILNSLQCTRNIYHIIHAQV